MAITGGGSAEAAGATADPALTSASILPIDETDGMDRIIEKAARIVPRPSQVAWQQREISVFTHFGMNTFTNREWGSGMEVETRFTPSHVDVDQWMQVYKAMARSRRC